MSDRSFVAGAVFVFVLAWTLRASEGRRALDACDVALDRGDHVEAILLARAAAEARCPLCAAPPLGYERLGAIAKAAEDRADPATAVAAWRAARAAALGTVVLDGSPIWRARAEAELVRLEPRASAAAGESPSPAVTEARLRSSLAGPAVPSGVMFVLVSLGAVVFAAAAARFARAPTFRPAELAAALAGGAIVAVGLLLF